MSSTSDKAPIDMQLALLRDGVDLYLLLNDRKIAKCGDAGTWIALAPDVVVHDDGVAALEITISLGVGHA
jgi:hypothetical protein